MCNYFTPTAYCCALQNNFVVSGAVLILPLSQNHPHDYPYMQKTCDIAEKAILAKENLPKKCVNRDKM